MGLIALSPPGKMGVPEGLSRKGVLGIGELAGY